MLLILLTRGSDVMSKKYGDDGDDGDDGYVGDGDDDDVCVVDDATDTVV